MSRRGLKYWRMPDFKGGINIEPENAKPNQLLDARNVWAPHGILETRPGTIGIAGLSSRTSNSPPVLLAFENVATGAFSFAGPGSNLLVRRGVGSPAKLRTAGQAGDHWFVGWSPAGGNPGTGYTGITIPILVANTAAATFKTEYWNGTEWHHLNVGEVAPVPGKAWVYQQKPVHLNSTGSLSSFNFSVPRDWVTTSIGGSAAFYWLRFTLISANGVTTDLDVGTQIDNGSAIAPITSYTVGSDCTFRGVYRLQYFNTKRYLTVQSGPNAPSTCYGNTGHDIVLHTAPIIKEVLEPPTVAVVPQFEEAFMANGYQMTVHRPNPADRAVSTVEFAEVEKRQEFVGTVGGIKADFHPDYVPQLSTFPAAKYIQFFQGQLWVAGIKDEPYTVRWSAPQPTYKVWPNESYEILMENDNSPITGMKATSEYLAIFKQDSIWIMAPGLSSEITGLNTYIPVRRVGGLGCVANSSIVEINGNLIFLAEDGVYAFNGQTATKISGDLDHLFLDLTAGTRSRSVACHWRTKHAYLLAVALNGDRDPNDIFVYDYLSGSWWRWNGLDDDASTTTFGGISHLTQDEGQDDNENIVLVDTTGRVNVLGLGKTDNGAPIDAWILTHRIGYGASWPFYLNEVQLHGQAPDISASEATVYRQDDPIGTAGTIDWRDDLEIKTGTFVLGTDKLWPQQRRYRRLVFRESGRWFQLKFRVAQKNAGFELSQIAVGYSPKA